MNNLTPFEEKVLAVLKKLQYLCDITTSYRHNTKPGIEYCFGDFFPPVVGQEELRDVVQYLNKNRLKISITFPIYSNGPEEPTYQKKYGDAKNVPLGLIKGKNMEAIKAVIKENINKLSPETKTQQPPEIDKNSKIKKPKPKFTAKIKIVGNSLHFGGDKIPIKSGQNGIAQLFIKNATTYSRRDIRGKGKPLKLDEFRQAGHYLNENSVREGLNNFRTKIKKKGWPIKIEPVGGGCYQMEIFYEKKQKNNAIHKR